MKLFRFTRAGTTRDGRLIRAGEEALLPDDTIAGPHMIDVATGIAGAPEEQPLPVPFRSDLAHDPHPQPPAPEVPAAPEPEVS